MTADEVHLEDSGDWNCEMQSYPNKNDEYRSDQEYTNVQALRKATVALTGPLELILFEGETAEFICKAKGQPLPEKLDWRIARDPIPGWLQFQNDVRIRKNEDICN